VYQKTFSSEIRASLDSILPAYRSIKVKTYNNTMLGRGCLSSMLHNKTIIHTQSNKIGSRHNSIGQDYGMEQLKYRMRLKSSLGHSRLIDKSCKDFNQHQLSRNQGFESTHHQGSSKSKIQKPISKSSLQTLLP